MEIAPVFLLLEPLNTGERQLRRVKVRLLGIMSRIFSYQSDVTHLSAELCNEKHSVGFGLWGLSLLDSYFWPLVYLI